MEQWEALIEACPTPIDPSAIRYFCKAIQTAEVVLKEDLAPFETEWLFQTLLYKPIELLRVVSTMRSDAAWSKPIIDGLKVLTTAAERQTEDLLAHMDEIVQICLLPFNALIRQQALLCLCSIAKVSAIGAKDVSKHISSLEGSTGKAPLAKLIGTICEHHPETVEDNINIIWRNLLRLLDNSKNTDKVTSSILEGILGVFKHFGCDLPTAELNAFYDKIVSDYIRIPSCEDVCLRILTEHSSLFRERISKDVRIRNFLWNTLQDSTGTSLNRISATTSVYKSICTCLEREQIQKIASTEIAPQTLSHRTQVKYTALRLLSFIQTNCNINIEVDGHIDVATLEYELRHENVSYDVAEAVSWCIESGLPCSDKLLQTAILFYNNLPFNRRKDIVVHGILKVKELRTLAITFLISESTQNSTSLDDHLPLWKDIFDTNRGKDLVVIEKCKLVFEDFMGYVVFVLDGFLQQEIEKPSEKLSTLLKLTTQVLTYQTPEEYTSDYCIVLLPLLTELLKLYSDSVAMSTARCACTHITDPSEHVHVLKEFYQVIRIDRCNDEALLCESCLSLVQAPDEMVDAANIMMALQITFSRNDVDPLILCEALKKLETIIVSEEDNLDTKIFKNILHHIVKISNRQDLSGKDARILRRDILMFLGKHGTKMEVDSFTEDIIIVKLMDSLTLNVSNPNEGSNYKFNLQKILQLALEHGDPASLQTLLIIICANLSTKRDSNLQQVLARVCHALSVAHSRGLSTDPRTLQAAVTMCDSGASVHGMLQYISEEKAPGVRKMLSDALEVLLVNDHECTLVNSVAEQAALMMKSEESTTKRAGLNITETLISSLKDKNLCTQQLMPELLELIPKTFEIDSEVTFGTATKHFLEKIELFENVDTEKILKSLLEVIFFVNNSKNKMADTTNDKMAESEVRIYKATAKMILEFIKSVMDYKKQDYNKIGAIICDILNNENCDFEKTLYALAKYKNVLGFTADIDKNILNKTFSVEFEMVEPYFRIEAVLFFLQEYEKMLLELYYQETLQLLGKIITELTPECTKYLNKNIKRCLSLYYTNKSTPSVLKTSIERWCLKQPLEEITKNIENKYFTTDNSIIVFSLKTMLDLFYMTEITELSYNAQKWPRILLKLYSDDYITDYLKSQMSYLTDILAVSVKFLKVPDVKMLISEGSSLVGMSTEKIGVRFCRYFMHVFFNVILKRPQILLDEDMKNCCILLNDIVKFAIKKKCTNEEYDIVLDLVDKLWPTYENQTSFDQKHSLLLDLNNFPKKLDRESYPLQWAVNVVVSGDNREEKARLIGVLPGGIEYSQAYRTFASTLPTRLSELAGTHTSLVALLDALANTRDLVLLDIVMTLAGGDDTKGWWDEAIDSCMASIAASGDTTLCKAVYARCWVGLTMGVCRRVLLPLLRYSSTSFNEEFFSTILKELLTFKVLPASNHSSYHKSIIDHNKRFTILQVACEKISPASIESPSSSLYKEVKPSRTWHLTRTMCKLCDSLKSDKLKLPVGADDKFKEDYRQFQCANYNCFAAAICRQRPEAKFYNHIFDAQVWDTIVDHNKEYTLWIKHQWNQRTTRQPVSIEVETSVSSSLSKGSARTATVRSRVFLRTLSESPLMFDLIEHNTDEEIITQDLQLPSNPLNEHECAGTLTALLCHMSTSQDSTWLDRLCGGLVESKRNASWLLAQAVCNCKEELKAHASTLRPALLVTVANTPIEVNGKKVLNGLHIEILETILQWGDGHPSSSTHLNITLELLLATGVEHVGRKAVYRTIANVITKFLETYRSVVSVPADLYEPYLKGPETPKALLIHIPSVMPTMLTKLENMKQYQPNDMWKIGEIVGLTLKEVNASERHRYLARFRKILDRVRQASGANYVKLLYYAQRGCDACCDEYNFRMTTNLTQKLVAEKLKCLQILTTFVQASSSEYIQEMYESIDLPDLLLQECLEAFDLVKAGIGVMSDSVKRRLVMIAAKYCQHSLGKVRLRAAGVLLRAFEDLLASPEQPQPKRTKTSSTVIISKILSKDVYSDTVLSSLSCCCVDKDEAVNSSVREGIAKMLHKDMGIRFVECFLLTVYLPPSSVASRNSHECLLALIDMLLSDLMGQERFRRIQLRDEPLELRSDNRASSKLLTMSRTYQGTFRRRNFTSKRNNLQAQDTGLKTPEIDVQITIERILGTFIQFSKETPQASQTLCLELIRAIKPANLDSEMAQALAAILETGVNELTPFVIEVCLLFIDELAKVDGILTTIEKLIYATKNSEGEDATKMLYKDVKLRCKGHEQFVLGCDEYEEADVAMDENVEFCIDDMTSAFGKLSNWDHLTLHQRHEIQADGLPPLWTDRDKFREQLENYRGEVGWFGKMSAAYRRDDKENLIKWLRETDKWPRRHFHISAITEAIEWQNYCDKPNSAPCDIQPSDCLAEWAARLMIRSAHHASLSESEPSQGALLLSRSHELKWCMRANEMQLSNLVLGCVKRNFPNLTQTTETLPWLYQKVLALRAVGLQNNDSDVLTKALSTADKYTPKLIEDAEPDVVVRVSKLILDLNKDLNYLTKDNFNKVFEMIESANYCRSDLNNNKETLHSIYEMAMSYYDDLWETSAETETDQNALLTDMTDILTRCTEMNILDEGMLAIILNKLDDLKMILNEDVAKELLNQVQRNLNSIDDFTLQQLTSHSNLFPSRSLPAYPFMSAREDEAVVKYKRCLQLLCDPEHSLLQYCSVLRNALKTSDEDQWEATFKRMKDKLFENPYSGSDYQLLNRYKAKLYEICEYDMSPSFKATADKILKEIGRLLSQRPSPSVLRASQLCNALSRCEDCPGKLLGLKNNVTVVRFDEQVAVFNSIRRPALFKVLLSDGTTKRCLHKSGEPLESDAAAQKVLRYVGRVWKGKCPIVGYNVTPLSDDCGLIEFLEDHETLRQLVGGTEVLDAALDSVPRLADHELILSPIQANLNQHKQLCDKVPSHLLRDAIIRRSASERDRWLKTKNFQDTLAASTIVTWLLGVGDRHLENILYSLQDGRICHIDWGAVLQYGSKELPAARLTRNLLAVCCEQELEALLQQLLMRLRQSRNSVLAVIKISFKWMEYQFTQKYPKIKSTLLGHTLSYNVTREMYESDYDENKSKVVDLLDRVFQRFQQKQQYSVQEQISCLLQHCTDPQILSVTRSLWEPWV